MIPDTKYFESDELKHDFNSHFNPPGLTNFCGVVQVDNDLTGIRGLNFPPFGTSLNRTCGLYIDGRYFPSFKTSVLFKWRPDRITRKADVNGIKYKSKTMIIPDQNAVVIELTLHNTLATDVDKEIKLQMNGGVTKNTADWANWIPPMENGNSQTFDKGRNSILFSSKIGDAHLLQGLDCFVDEINRFGIIKKISVPSGKKVKIFYFAVLGEKVAKVQAIFDLLKSRKESLLNENRNYWDNEIKSVFDMDNPTYSGSLPILITGNKSIEKLYHMGIMGVIYFRRDNPISSMGRAYDTLMPRYWQTVTFIWDYYLSGMVHSLLDPQVMKKYLEKWMKMDIHTCFGSEYISGKPVGPWYAINDHAMVMMIKEYLDWSGDFQWLDSMPDGRKTVLKFLEYYTNQYKEFLTKNGLADYGGINNLLECVSTYVHEVGSLNAANIANLIYIQELFSFTGEKKKSIQAGADIESLFNSMKDLYVQGKGYWRTRQPDGSYYDVKHAYDFFTIINTIGKKLDDKQKNEMVEFFLTELKTDKWMRALSESDENAMFSVRPDHQWNGAYPAWPSQSLMALINAGKSDIALNWIDTLVETANQGPFGQAHFSETIMDLDSGGARKSSAEQPWICDWTCSSNGNWVEAILRGFAGLKTNVNGSIQAEPNYDDLELYDLHYRGKIYELVNSKLQIVK